MVHYIQFSNRIERARSYAVIISQGSKQVWIELTEDAFVMRLFVFRARI